MNKTSLEAATREQTLAEHQNPGKATVQVLTGRVHLGAGEVSWEGRTGDLLVVPPQHHDLTAIEDTAVLFTIDPHRWTPTFDRGTNDPVVARGRCAAVLAVPSAGAAPQSIHHDSCVYQRGEE